jgi:eukaryotic-like serine/threonine-protein kinase
MIGTPGYMAPEQARGEPADARADIWSLGAILFELLTNEPLVARKNLHQMIADTLFGPDARPSARGVDEVAPELEELCASAAHPQREERLDSARALSDGLERFLDGDRDQEARRARAEELASQAAEAAREALERDDEGRRAEAARDAGRALAFDASHEGARRTLLSLFTVPPKRIPAAAKRELDAAQAKQLGEFYRSSLFAVSFYAPWLAVFFFVDVREPWAIWLATALMLSYVGCAGYGLLRPRGESLVPFALAFVTSAALFCVSRLVGPYLVLPLIAAMNAVVTALHPGRAPRVLVALVGVLPVLGAALAELFGWLPATTRFEGGLLVVEPRLFELGADLPILWILLGASTLPIVLDVVLLGRIRDQALEAQAAVHVQRWQLEQLVPRAPE